MPQNSRQVDVEQGRGERKPAPAGAATPQELTTAAGAGDVKLTKPKLLPDEKELRPKTLPNLQAPSGSPSPSQTLPSEAVLDALKMMLIGASLTKF